MSSFNVSHSFSRCRFQPLIAVYIAYRMHVTSMRSSNSCAHATSMLLDIRSKGMSRARALA